MSPEKYGQSAFTVPAVAEKDVLAFFCCFQDCYCYSNSDIMCHVTKYCNVIGPHCTLRQNTTCIHSPPDLSLLLQKWVWLARLFPTVSQHVWH